MAVVSAGHMFTDMSQGAVPALLPFLKSHMHLSYAALSALVLAATISSSGTCSAISTMAWSFRGSK